MTGYENYEEKVCFLYYNTSLGSVFGIHNCDGRETGNSERRENISAKVIFFDNPDPSGRQVEKGQQISANFPSCTASQLTPEQLLPFLMRVKAAIGWTIGVRYFV
jgi:hypothetical protein